MNKATHNIVKLGYNHIMSYDWGISDHNCLINQLRHQQHERYAELWMGTHPKGCSKLTPNQSLTDYLKKKEINSLPFLYKVLCIEKALSIQLHPNKQQAQQLHQTHPQLYDDNEKPEMFYTLTEFQCLFGIINQEQLEQLFTIEPFCSLKSKSSMKIKEIIVELLSFPENIRKEQIDTALKNIQAVFPNRKLLLLKLQDQFPYDEGILVSCLLKHKIIGPGHCFAIAAGVPHAYIKGTCLEIMKNSDNVVRLGLTPKLKDVKTMLEIMNDKVGLDGLKVQLTDKGYYWNNLILNPVTVKEETTDLQIENDSIGILFEGTLRCEELNFTADKGDIFFIHAGNYTVKGPCNIHFGSFSQN